LIVVCLLFVAHVGVRVPLPVVTVCVVGSVVVCYLRCYVRLFPVVVRYVCCSLVTFAVLRTVVPCRSLRLSLVRCTFAVSGCVCWVYVRYLLRYWLFVALFVCSFTFGSGTVDVDWLPFG